MRKGLIYLLVFVLLLIAPAGVRYFQFYRAGSVERELPEPFDPDAVKKVDIPSSSSFVDEPQEGDGFVLLDMAHNNQFTLDEIGYLDGRLSQRGFDWLPYSGGDLSTALRSVSAFVVITPLADFSGSEIAAVSDFVDRGGRLLMVGDPTRFDVRVEEDEFSFNVIFETDKIPLNSLANEFDVIFNGDYLYNVVENEGNFRNILLNEVGFGESDLTDGLEQLAFYGSHSLQVGPTGTSLLSADDDTSSSATDRAGGLTLAATSRNGRVLSLGDIHFLFEPYYTVFDNGRFIAQIADFLTESGGREYSLADFPYFFGDELDLVYTGSPELGANVFDEIITLQDEFGRIGIDLSLAAEVDETHDTLILGIYNQADDLSKLLEELGISLLIEPPVLTEEEQAVLDEEEEAAEDETEPDAEDMDDEEPEEPVELVERLIQSDLGDIQMSGTALMLFDADNGRSHIILLAASTQGLENSVNRLLQLIPLNAEAALADCLLQDNLALCPTNIADEEVEAELQAGGATPPDSNGTGDDDGDEDDGGDDPVPTPEPEDNPDLDAIYQGDIFIGDTVEGILAESETHGWVFNSGPAIIDISVTGNDEVDIVLELYDANNALIDSIDATFTGESEELLGIDIPDSDPYTIVVRDFFADGGEYTLTVTGGVAVVPPEPGSGIFVFSDDDGTALTNGISSSAALADLLSDDYDVTTWVSTSDGPLQEDTLDGYELVIWDTGDYLDEDGFLGEDTGLILTFADEGGKLMITGSAPALFDTFERAPLSAVQVNGNDPILSANLSDGQLIELDATYETVLSEFLLEDLEDGSIGFLLRDPDSGEGAGSVIGIAAVEGEFNTQKTAVILFPFAAMPTDIQETLITNILNWFEMSAG